MADATVVRVRDVEGGLWWLGVETWGELRVDTTFPYGAVDAAAGLIFGRLRFADPSQTMWYIVPTPEGQWLFSPTPVGSMPEVQSGLQLYDANGMPWVVWMNTPGELAVSQDLVPVELVPRLPEAYVRFCPIHRVAFDADPVIYRDAGRCCPAGGEILRGFLDRFRDEQNPLADGMVPENWNP